MDTVPIPMPLSVRKVLLSYGVSSLQCHDTGRFQAHLQARGCQMSLHTRDSTMKTCSSGERVLT